MDYFSNFPADVRPESLSARIAEQFLSTSPDYYRPENGYRGNRGYGFGREIQYSVVSLWANALECARLTGDKALESRLVAAWEPYYGGARAMVLPKFKHVDFTVIGAVPLEIALLTGDERARALGLGYADQQWEEPKPDDPPPWYNATPYEERLAWWRQGYSDQTRLWIDDTYMIGFLQTQAWRVTGDAKYLDRSAREMALYLDRLQRPNGLFFHAPDAPFFWGRGNGWMAGAMALFLRFLPEGSEWRPRIMEGYLKMMAALLKCQREDGMWGQLIDDPGAWAESSGTGMFASAFADGVSHGWLDAAAYGPAMRRAYFALAARMDEWGNVAGTSHGLPAQQTREKYIDHPRVNGDSHGQAAMLWLIRAILEARKAQEAGNPRSLES